MSKVNTTIAAFALAFIANEMFFEDSQGRNIKKNITPSGDMTANAGNALTAANVAKNPGITANDSDLPYFMHRRQSVTYDEIAYSSAGRIIKNGDIHSEIHCSGNVIELEEYKTVPENGILVSTAAHCFQNLQPDDEFNFVLDFMDENNVINTYKYSRPQIWTNPRYNIDIEEEGLDQALLFFPGLSLPEEITPARLEIYSEHIVNDFTPHYFNDIDITAAGYSRDIFGLSRDTDCYIKTIYTPSEQLPLLETNCQIYFGGSGSGLIFENFANEDPAQKTIGAITAEVSKNTDFTADNFFSTYAMFYHHNLAEVPFLQRKDICARVSAESGLYVRSKNYNEQGSVRTSLPFNEVVYVTDMLYDEQEQYGRNDVWLEVRKRDNPDPQTPDGYASSAWLEETPCPPAL